MNEDIADFALTRASSLSVEYADVRVEHQVKNNIVLKNGLLDAVLHIVDEGLGIRILTREGMGFSSTSRLDKKNVEKAVKEAYRQARACKRKSPITVSQEDPVQTTWVVRENQPLSNVGVENKIENLFEWEKRVSSLGNVPARILILVDKQTSKLFLNSEGSRIEGYLPIISCFYFLVVKENGQVEQTTRRFGYAGGWEGFEQFGISDDAQNEVIMLKTLIKEGKQAPQGIMDLVAGSDVVGIVCHESCGHPTEADRILGREASQAGASFMKQDMLGTPIGSRYVTVAEDPTLEHSYGFHAYDDEGVKTRRRFLYKEGLINEFLHNRETAAAMGTRSNAAARSTSYCREPIVRMANTFLLPGDYEFEELIEDIDRGIYMKSYTEWNIDDKRYNQKYVGRESYLIEKGQIRHMVRRPILEVTTPGFWRAVDACGKDLHFIAGNCGKGDPIQEMDVLYGGPTTRLRNVPLR
ncbi:MAG: TldD/PmbA family protein [Theionarchaea archaeon]|nr:TldD/PmbA family protein [Theionarchaea archaeon]